MKSIEALRALLPWYANGTLGEEEAVQVETWLMQDARARAELETWRRMMAAVESQLEQRPGAEVRRRVLGQIRLEAQAPARTRMRWSPAGLVGAAALAMVVLVALWLAIKPGVVLQWTVDGGSTPAGDGVAAYRVYRAPLGSAEYRLLHEAPARAGMQEYTYIDALLLPGQAFSYQVEGVNEAGRVALSQTVSGSAQAALPGQMAILFTSLLAGASTVMLLQARHGDRTALRRGILV